MYSIKFHVRHMHWEKKDPLVHAEYKLQWKMNDFLIEKNISSLCPFSCFIGQEKTSTLCV